MDDSIINAPAEIWLVYGDIEGEGEVRHEECVEVCWNEERQWPHDVRYVRADIADKLRIAHVRLQADLEDLMQCAIKTIPAEWWGNRAFAGDVMNYVAEYVGELQHEIEAARAKIAQLGGAPMPGISYRICAAKSTLA